MQKKAAGPIHLKVLRSAILGAVMPILIVVLEWLTYALRPHVSGVFKPAAEFIDQAFFGVNFLLSFPGLLLQFSLGLKPIRIVTFSVAALSMAALFALFTVVREYLCKTYDSKN